MAAYSYYSLENPWTVKPGGQLSQDITSPVIVGMCVLQLCKGIPRWLSGKEACLTSFPHITHSSLSHQLIFNHTVYAENPHKYR